MRHLPGEAALQPGPSSITCACTTSSSAERLYGDDEPGYAVMGSDVGSRRKTDGECHENQVRRGHWAFWSRRQLVFGPATLRPSPWLCPCERAIPNHPGLRPIPADSQPDAAGCRPEFLGGRSDYGRRVERLCPDRECGKRCRSGDACSASAMAAQQPTTRLTSTQVIAIVGHWLRYDACAVDGTRVGAFELRKAGRLIEGHRRRRK